MSQSARINPNKKFKQKTPRNLMEVEEKEENVKLSVVEIVKLLLIININKIH